MVKFIGVIFLILLGLYVGLMFIVGCAYLIWGIVPVEGVYELYPFLDRFEPSGL